jgi:hypothetical protein
MQQRPPLVGVGFSALGILLQGTLDRLARFIAPAEVYECDPAGVEAIGVGGIGLQSLIGGGEGVFPILLADLDVGDECMGTGIGGIKPNRFCGGRKGLLEPLAGGVDGGEAEIGERPVGPQMNGLLGFGGGVGVLLAAREAQAQHRVSERILRFLTEHQAEFIFGQFESTGFEKGGAAFDAHQGRLRFRVALNLAGNFKIARTTLKSMSKEALHVHAIASTQVFATRKTTNAWNFRCLI